MSLEWLKLSDNGVQQQPRKLVATAITTAVWRFTVTVHDVQIYHDFMGCDWRNTYWNILASFYWTDNSRYNVTGKFLVSGRILVFTRPIILFYSHKLYIQNYDNMIHIFFFISKMYSACSLSFFNYPYVSPNVQTKLLSILEPTHNLVLTKVSP